jgi:hypothetical protein
MRALRWLFVLLCLVAARPVCAADEVKADFEKDVAPLFKKYCLGCHNPTEREGKLSLESYAELLKGGEHGPVVVAEDAAGSRLIRVLIGGEPKMPPEGEPQPTEVEVAVLKAWVAGGARGPAGVEPDRTKLIVPKIASNAKVRPVTSVDWSKDGSLVAVAQAGVVLIQAKTGDKLETVATLEGFPGKVNAVHIAADNSRLLVATGIDGLFGEARLYDLKTRALLKTFQGHRDILYDAELSPDGKTLATCSYDRKIILWNPETGEQIRTLEGHNGAVYDVAFHPTLPVLVSASADDTCKLWNTATGERLDTLGQPLKEQYSVSFSPDGEQVVAAGADNRLRVWKFLSKEKPEINPLLIARFAHEGAISRIAFTTDGSKLVSIADDRTIKLWETKQYTELKLFDKQPEVAAALAVSGTGEAFLVGRMDGSLQTIAIDPSLVASAAPSADAGHSPVATAPMPSAPMTTAAEQEPNNVPDKANAITIPATVTGVIQAGESQTTDADLYRISAKAGQEWVVEINAARSKSPLDSFVEVLTTSGERIPQVQLQAVRDSYFTFRGKDANQPDDFRVFNWEEMELNEYLYSGGEISKLWLYPRGPDSGFKVYPGAGQRYGYFDTTPVVHALGEPCYIVQPTPPGQELIPNGLPVFTLYFQNDDDGRRELGADSRLTFTAPQDGDYLVRVRDVRGFQGDAYKYTLTVRPRQPDFKVIVHGGNPTVSAGSSREFRVEVVRQDWFEGPIQVELTGLPPGFTATTPIIIEGGQNNALGVLSAAADAVAPMGDAAKTTKAVASADIRGQKITHEAGGLGEIKLGPKPKILLSVVPTEGGAKPLDSKPGAPLEFEILPGQTIMLKAIAQRDGYTGNIPFGNEDSGRNLPHGVYIDNIGLNGLLMVENTSEREFFITAAKWVPEQSRLFHLRTTVEGEQATFPVMLHIRGPKAVAGR